MMNSQGFWFCELGEQARHRQIRPTETAADEVGAAVCKLLLKRQSCLGFKADIVKTVNRVRF